MVEWGIDKKTIVVWVQLESGVQHMGQERCGLESAMDHYACRVREAVANTCTAVQQQKQQVQTRTAQNVTSSAVEIEVSHLHAFGDVQPLLINSSVDEDILF